ncbi:hypothetical protein ANN_09711 [Periplaneta americana]|uniref:Uncharacterized protein n=1 Tax=Periplaneta americana TaxID=6978 RepID=A0ABQ8TM21_PERAM|nr:hypothetical protein ANN_09711 [Periplaneta americana]
MAGPHYQKKKITRCKRRAGSLDDVQDDLVKAGIKEMETDLEREDFAQMMMKNNQRLSSPCIGPSAHEQHRYEQSEGVLYVALLSSTQECCHASCDSSVSWRFARSFRRLQMKMAELAVDSLEANLQLTWLRTREELFYIKRRESLKSYPESVDIPKSQDNHCKRCLSQIETLRHVLGAYPYAMHRHHAVRTKLTDALRRLKYTVYEEVQGTSDNGSNRLIDIIAISESLYQGMITDLTIRFETYKGQPEDIYEEKRAIYVPTIPYYEDKYQLNYISVTR